MTHAEAVMTYFAREQAGNHHAAIDFNHQMLMRANQPIVMISIKSKTIIIAAIRSLAHMTRPRMHYRHRARRHNMAFEPSRQHLNVACRPNVDIIIEDAHAAGTATGA